MQRLLEGVQLVESNATRSAGGQGAVSDVPQTLPMTTTPLPAPSKAHATCAWCRIDFLAIGDLLTHVDNRHLVPGSVPAARHLPKAA